MERSKDIAVCAVFHPELETKFKTEPGENAPTIVYGNLTCVSRKHPEDTLDDETVGTNTFIGALSAHYPNEDPIADYAGHSGDEETTCVKTDVAKT